MHWAFVHVWRVFLLDLARLVGGVRRNRDRVVAARGILRDLEIIACRIVW
jgi:hypothetical protein